MHSLFERTQHETSVGRPALPLTDDAACKCVDERDLVRHWLETNGRAATRTGPCQVSTEVNSLTWYSAGDAGNAAGASHVRRRIIELAVHLVERERLRVRGRRSNLLASQWCRRSPCLSSVARQCRERHQGPSGASGARHFERRRPCNSAPGPAGFSAAVPGPASPDRTAGRGSPAWPFDRRRSKGQSTGSPTRGSHVVLDDPGPCKRHAFALRRITCSLSCS